MEKIKRYEFDGLILDIPVHYDEKSEIYIEDYPNFAENPMWTPGGHRVMFSGEDACRHAEEVTPGGCPDCGSCKHYIRASEHTWIGICTHESNFKKDNSQNKEDERR